MLLSCTLFGLYVFHYFSQTPIIHPECITNRTLEFLNNTGTQPFVEGLYRKTFNLQHLELGAYRPRALAFLVAYLDTNLLVAIYDRFPAWGARLPFTLIAAICLILSVGFLFRQLFPELPISAGWLVGSSLLFFENYQAGTYVLLRSAKLLAPSACILVFVTFFRSRDRRPRRSSAPQHAASAFGLFVLATLDEQVLACLAFVAGLSCVLSAIDRRLSVAAVQSAGALLLYLSFHAWWGMLLFQAFTPVPIGPHRHDLSQVVTAFTIEAIPRAGILCAHILRTLFLRNFFTCALLMAAAIHLWRTARGGDLLVALALGALCPALIACLVITHPDVYALRDLWDSMYLVPPACVFLIAILFALSRGAESPGGPTQTWAVLLVMVLLVAAAFNGQFRIREYHDIHLDHHGGHLGVVDNPGPFNKIPGVNPTLFDRAIMTH